MGIEALIQLQQGRFFAPVLVSQVLSPYLALVDSCLQEVIESEPIPVWIIESTFRNLWSFEPRRCFKNTSLNNPRKRMKVDPEKGQFLLKRK